MNKNKEKMLEIAKREGVVLSAPSKRFLMDELAK